MLGILEDSKKTKSTKIDSKAKKEQFMQAYQSRKARGVVDKEKRYRSTVNYAGKHYIL